MKEIDFKKIIGAIIIIGAVPLPIWLFWQESYVPEEGTDAWFNSFHPYVAGLIGELMILAFVGIICLGVFLIKKED